MNPLELVKSKLLKYRDVNTYLKATYLLLLCIGVVLFNTFFMTFYLIISLHLFFRAMLVLTIVIIIVILLILNHKLIIASILGFTSMTLYLLMGYFHLGGMSSYSLPLLLTTMTFSFFYFGFKGGIALSSFVLISIGLDIAFSFSEHIGMNVAISNVSMRWVKFATYIIALATISSFFVFSINRVTRLYNEKQKESDKNARLVKKMTHQLDEKTILLKEIHHRVKNNLQIINSLLRLQSNLNKNKDFIKSVNESQSRIQSMALVHEVLYQNENLAWIDMSKYFEKLTDFLFYNYDIDKNSISHSLYIEPIMLNIESAVPYGLIFNEILSNSLKYAFPAGTKGHIDIKFYKQDNLYILCIADNGKGFQKEINIKNPKTLGLSLVNDLVNQLGGDIHMKTDNGVNFTIHTNCDNRIFKKCFK
jgi:two-component sensor histidine kinase